ncbi:MAG: o-succinylbenzoate synthase [Candidatus Omnitrophica bacterium]|nr:o-succinylbenzoate synthase [Candidatus Omnitrophota bacterium]
MQPLTITGSTIIPFTLPLVRPFNFAGHTIRERSGYYLEITTPDGLTAQGEIAPLPGISSETLKKAKHDAREIQPALVGRPIPLEKDELIDSIRNDGRLCACCPSVRFGVESALFDLASRARQMHLTHFLEAPDGEIASAVLLQGTHGHIIARAKEMKACGHRVFKLKVGDRNIPLDVKKVQDLRGLIGKEGVIRLDANKIWSFSEAVLFAHLAGPEQIEFMEEPLSDTLKLDEFYKTTHMPVALDETLSVLRCGATAPSCMLTLTAHEGVKAYVIKPMVLGGVIIALDWIEEAGRLGKKAVISSAFESPVGLRVLKALAALSGQTAGLGTEYYL